MIFRFKKIAILFSVLGVLAMSSTSANQASQSLLTEAKKSQDVVYTFDNHQFSLEFDQSLGSRVRAKFDGKPITLGEFSASEYVVLKDEQRISEFAYQGSSEKNIETDLGVGHQVVLTGLSASGLQKKVIISGYDNFPLSAFFTVEYTNVSSEPIKVQKWVNNAYKFLPKNKKNSSATKAVDFWSYEGASYEDRRDWVKPLNKGYEQANYMGMNASDYGSGTAIVDIWREDVGLAIGHVETSPKLVALPVSYVDESVGAQFHIELEKITTLKPQETLKTIETFATVHQSDYYATLKSYRQVMAAKGLKIDPAPDSAYEPIWCAWGYERDFEIDDVLATLPKAKELGLEWAVLDDGWQTAEGDWYLNKEKFPNGDADMRDFVSKINDAGLKAKLWWAPLAVDPGTDLLHEHSDMLLLDENGAVHDVTWWNSFYLCPAYEGTRQHTKALVKKMMGDWGYSGLKIDGQHLNGVPPCYNPAHKHDSPNDSVEQLGEFWKMVYDTALEINPEAVIEICPCGTSYAFHNMPFMNQAVSSDPLTSWQVRHKGKTLKGLMGESAPYYGDHVELSDNANDFASSFGIGGILGTKFTVGSHHKEETVKELVLDAEKEQVWSKWISLYNEKMLPKGTYLGELYDIGFDLPETHAIQKGDRLYYAFYAKEWHSAVELRGLNTGKYQVNDYFNNKVLGEVHGPTATLDVAFEEYLLLELIPISQVTQAQ